MFHIVDSSGRIIEVEARMYDSSYGALDAEETLIKLLDKLPEGQILCGAVKAPVKKCNEILERCALAPGHEGDCSAEKPETAK